MIAKINNIQRTVTFNDVISIGHDSNKIETQIESNKKKSYIKRQIMNEPISIVKRPWDVTLTSRWADLPHQTGYDPYKRKENTDIRNM